MLKKLEDEIVKRRTDLAELETAARVLRRLSEAEASSSNGRTPVQEPAQTKAVHHGPRDMAGLNIEDSCKKILHEKGNHPMHFKAVAEEALRRGYTTGRRASTPKSIVQSYWATMKRKPEVFEAAGKGTFKLRE